MCGIVALFAYGRAAAPVERAELVAIRDAMIRRGPDAAGAWIGGDGRVGLGHRRLSIIDVGESGNQPMHLDRSGLSITFNGEIYNYRALRAELQQEGCVVRTASDTEVILHLYDRRGAAGMDRLRGMFAFALWDGRRNGMLLARDPFGIKPLYYADDGSMLRVASQVRALLAGGRVGASPSAAGEVGFLLWGSVPEPHTLYRDIKALPAGATLWVDGNGPRAPARFWDLRAVLARAQAAGAGAGAQAGRSLLRDALVDSVRHHLIADVPVGVFLSGGLDSGAMVALAAEADLRTLTLGFEELRGTAADEVPFATQTAAAFGTRHSTDWIGSDVFAGERQAVLDAMDQPSIDGVNVYFVSRMAAASRLKVALSGLGGDELFAGYPSFRQVPRLVRLLRPFGLLPGIGPGLRALSAPVLRHLTSPKYAGLFEYGGSVGGAYLLRRGLFMPWELPDLLEPETVRQGWGELAPIAHLTDTVAGLDNARAQVTALEMGMYMRNQLLRDADWAGMAHGVEIRVPFVDSRLFEQMAPLLLGPAPPGKQDMAGSLDRPLPAAILQRPKAGFVAPVRDWLLKGADQVVGSGERGLRGWAKYVLARHKATAPGPGRRAGRPLPATA